MTDPYPWVKCSRCGWEYRCTPRNDFYDPNPELGWTEGKVCFLCLVILAGRKEAQ